MKIKVGKLYVRTYTERKCGIEKEYEFVIFCTGSDIKPKWGNYKTISGVVVKNTDEVKDELQQIGSYSESWNADVFKEYDKKIIIDNKKYVEPVICGDNSD